MKPSSWLSRAATTSRDVEAIAGGPDAVGRRIQNRIIGRLVGRATRKLWRRR